MIVRPSHFLDSRLSQDQVDDIVNNFLCNAADFAEASCMDGRIFGVKTAGERFQTSLNQCARSALIGCIASANRRLEYDLRYRPYRHFHVQEFEWYGTERVYKVNDPGRIVALNKSRSVTVIGSSPVLYYLQAATIEESGGVCVAKVLKSNFPNPAKVLIRNQANVLKPLARDTAVSSTDTEWILTLSVSSRPPCTIEGETYHAQDTTLVKVTAPAEPACAGKIYPVYKGTKQRIPFARQSGRDFFIHSWLMVDEAFQDSEVDLSGANGEFYKLMKDVDFVCETTPTADPQVVYVNSYGDEEVVANAVEVSVQDADGFIKLSPASKTLKKGVYKVTVSLEIEPYFGADGAGNLQSAIAYLVAAELPIASCNCNFPDKNFISEAQKSYTKVRVNPMTQEVSSDLKFGSTHGHFTYLERTRIYRTSGRHVRM